MTDWTEIDPTTEIITGRPIPFEHGRAFYNNPIAIAEGAVGAPRFSRRAISPGGSGIDGAFTDATVMTGVGFYECDSIVWTTPRTLPSVCIIRCRGDVTISTTLTTPQPTASQKLAAEVMGCILGKDGAANTTGKGGGGGAGAGGSDSPGVGGAGLLASTTFRPWVALRPIIGGKGDADDGLLGGGVLVIICDGAMDLTGCTIGVETESGPTTSACGAAGTAFLLSAGTQTGGTVNASGGSAGSGVGGGGGWIVRAAPAFSGTQTNTAAGGAGQSGGARNGSAGVIDQVTLTEPEINALLLR